MNGTGPDVRKVYAKTTKLVDSVEYGDTPARETVFEGKRTITLTAGNVNGGTLVSKDKVIAFDLPVCPQYFFPTRMAARINVAIRDADGVRKLEPRTVTKRVPLTGKETEEERKLIDPDGNGFRDVTGMELPRVAPIDGIFDTLFSKVEVFSHGKPIRDYNHYGITSFVNVLLSTPASHIRNALWFLAGYALDDTWVDDRDATGGNEASWQVNEGLKQRQRRWAASEGAELCRELNIPIFNQELLLPLMSGWRIEFSLNSNDFCLMKAKSETQGAQLVITNFELLVDVADLRRDAQASIERPLKQKGKGRLSVPFQDLETTTLSIPAGSYNFSTHSDLGTPARQVIIFFAEEDAVLGDAIRSPLKFQNFDLARLELMADGKTQELEQNFAEGRSADVYRRILENISGDPFDTSLTPDRWLNNAAFFVFDATPGYTSNELDVVPDNWNKMSSWFVRGNFQRPLTTNVTMFIVREVDRVLEMDDTFTAKVV